MDRPLFGSGAATDVDPFPAIADYGIVGNLETVAMIANTGAVEFFCYPSFDSPSIFAAMLDRHAGSFTIAVEGAGVGTQSYVAGTNVLVTRFEGEGAVVEVTDFMPVGSPDEQNQLVRIVRAVSGTPEVTARCRPAFDYARGLTHASQRSDSSVVFDDGGTSGAVRLVADRKIALDDGAAVVSARLREGELLVLVIVCDGTADDLLACGKVDGALEQTIEFWRGWLARSPYDGEFREPALRSALALKLMMSDKHGSMVAAPTMALPETMGGDRNWDYRYCWLRDSAFTIYALLRLGFTDEAERYRCWIRDRAEAQNGRLHLMYRLDGGTEGLDEEVLDHLSGYRGSRPVRLGNGAFLQTQNDIYGEVIDTLYLARGNITAISDSDFAGMSAVVEETCRNWDKPGNGFWEMRGEPQFFLDAHLMPWVGIDRALRLCAKTGRPAPPKWEENRELLRRTIEDDFWNPRIGAFTQVKGGETVDAVALLLPLMKFLPTTDPRFASTLRRIEHRLVDGPRVRRYEPPPPGVEGLDDGGPEGSFVACSFWYIEVLARSGRVNEARQLFEEMLSLASPLGLFAEEVASDGSHLGNTPQALSHLTLISAAIAVSRAAASGGEPF